jgi:hypothetical protein
MKHAALVLLGFASFGVLRSQEAKLAPPPVTPAPGGFLAAPSDAKRLFEGKSVGGWTKMDGSATGCVVENGEMVCRTGAKDAFSLEKHRDAQIHVEFRVPKMPDKKGQLRGNSGVFLMGCYEAQVLDGIDNPTYADGMVGALYGFAAPLVNAARPPEEWQSYDIFYTAPKCSLSGEVQEVARATVLLNGVLVQNNTPMDTAKMKCRLKDQNLCQPGPMILQDHSGFPNPPQTEMRFRNIWLRHLN